MRIKALHTLLKDGSPAPPETVSKYGVKIEARNLDGTVTTRDYSVSETPVDFPREVAQVFLHTFDGLIAEVPEDEVIAPPEPGNEAEGTEELELAGVAADGAPKPRFRRKRQ